MGKSRPKKEDNAFYRILDKNWKGFVAGALTLLVPIAYGYYIVQKDKWDELDQAVTVLVNSIIDLDSVPPRLQPEIAALRSGRIKFERKYQSKNHSSEWHLFEKQIPHVSENSDCLRTTGHWRFVNPLDSEFMVLSDSRKQSLDSGLI